MVDARDVAAVAAVALTQPGHEGRIYELTGPEALSYSEIARRLTRAIGWPTTYVDATDEAMRERLTERLGDEWQVNAAVELFQEYRRSGAFGYRGRDHGHGRAPDRQRAAHSRRPGRGVAAGHAAGGVSANGRRCRRAR